MDHRFAAICTLTIGLAAAGATVLPQPAQAAIDRSGQTCFSVNGDPGDAAIVNLTPILASEPGNGQLISSDVKSDPPLASNANFGPGTVDPNAAVTPIGADGQVCFQNSVHSPVDLVADHLGTVDASAYTPATPSGAPDRKVDTRSNLGGGVIAPSGQLCFDVNGNPGDAAIVNLTPVLAGAAGDGQLISSDVKANPPVASNTNFRPGSVDPNVAVTEIGADGQVCYQNSVHTSVHLVADHLGSIAASAYTPATPSGAPDRKVDTRGNLGGGVIAPSGQLCFDVNGNPGDAAIVNLTPVLAGAAGDGQLISSDVKANPPVASNTNFRPGSVDPNVAVTEIGADGQVCYQNSVHTSVHLVADHLGSIAASAYTPATPSGAPDRKVDTRDGFIARGECAGSMATAFDQPTARTMLGLSHLAYEIEPNVANDESLTSYTVATDPFDEQMSCWTLVDALRGNEPDLREVTDTEVIVALNRQTGDLAVAFRGTEDDERDIKTDLDIDRISWVLPDGRLVSRAVHEGFATAYRAVRSQLWSVLENTPHRPGARVYFTGHSLGGALATLASVDLADDMQELGYLKNDVVTYTFGAPRSMSREMAGFHASLVPTSHAVANPRDPVPHLPPVLDGDSNPYSHLRQMTLTHGADGDPRVRFDRGDGRNYRGCPAMPIGDGDDHDRLEYVRRLRSTNVIGAPTVRISITDTTFIPLLPNTGGHFRLNWSSPLEAPCDWVGLFEDLGGSVGGTNTARRFTYTGLDVGTPDQHTTNIGKADDHSVAYVNMFGRVIASREYVPTTPTVSLHRAEKFLARDDIEFDWSVTDPGAHDLIVLFDRNPWTAGPTGYYRSIVGRVEAEASSAAPEETDVNVDAGGREPNDWWVAYIMVDDDGNQRILATSRGVQG